MSIVQSYWLYAYSPIHVGAGQGTGFVDLPVVREKVTGWPYIPGTSVKGVLRDEWERLQLGDVHRVFGTQDRAGLATFTDARLVCLPVASLFGTYAYVTCPLILQRLSRDMALAGFDLPDWPRSVDVSQARVAEGSKLGFQFQNADPSLYLLEFCLKADMCELTTSVARKLAEIVFEEEAWRQAFVERFVVVNDQMFQLFSEQGTQVDAHIRMGDHGTVANGALWYEESLPPESLLAGLVALDDPTEDVLSNFTGRRLMQIGGNATTGCGQSQLIFGPRKAVN
ncbi:type III-B CRISPR module RAMP protein Cmr4 [Alicyclobacillus vulcanalis]|uniref:CRISPR-associated protein, Cmr4 family n=1 Tax=Alicyclobacillus vulcanalis TaxID=252246 RepID=A0A1N7K6I7_9BACL|nr:type III-B CRISPR module RAMP protein Cmr4 [Alicyclobacillus vulcanalis]SIS57211.1 CRISPR-associated protein, Cmr4 family [Alicyclobacillus vulcanalis]